MKSELIMKNNNKNKNKYLEGKLFNVHGLYFKFIVQRNIPILKYMLVIIAYVAIWVSALIAIIIDHIIFSIHCKTIQTMSEIFISDTLRGVI